MTTRTGKLQGDIGAADDLFPGRTAMHKWMGPMEKFPCCRGRGWKYDADGAEVFCACAAGLKRREVEAVFMVRNFEDSSMIEAKMNAELRERAEKAERDLGELKQRFGDVRRERDLCERQRDEAERQRDYWKCLREEANASWEAQVVQLAKERDDATRVAGKQAAHIIALHRLIEDLRAGREFRTKPEEAPHMTDVASQVQAQVAALREALEWYADPANYARYYDDWNKEHWANALDDGGKRAKAALSPDAGKVKTFTSALVTQSEESPGPNRVDAGSTPAERMVPVERLKPVAEALDWALDYVEGETELGRLRPDNRILAALNAGIAVLDECGAWVGVPRG